MPASSLFARQSDGAANGGATMPFGHGMGGHLRRVDRLGEAQGQSVSRSFADRVSIQRSGARGRRICRPARSAGKRSGFAKGVASVQQANQGRRVQAIAAVDVAVFARDHSANSLHSTGTRSRVLTSRSRVTLRPSCPRCRGSTSAGWCLAQVVAQRGIAHGQAGIQVGRHVQHHVQVHAGIHLGW